MRADAFAFGDDDVIWFIQDSALYSFEQGAEKVHLQDLDSPKDLACGISGDGCGGGRVFICCADCVVVYDPQSGRVAKRITELASASSIVKKGCSLYLLLARELVEFDLSAFVLKSI